MDEGAFERTRERVLKGQGLPISESESESESEDMHMIGFACVPGPESLSESER